MFGWSYSVYTGSSSTSTSGGQWVGGILVGVVSGVLVIMTIVKSKKTNAKNNEDRWSKNNSIVIHFVDFFRSLDNSHQLNIGTVGNPTYEQTIIQSTQSNSNYQGRDITETPYSIPVNIRSNTSTNTCTLQVNDTNSGVPSFIYQDNVQIEGVYSLADD